MTTWHVSLVVDPIQCDGHGVCGELFPEWVSMDPWGYPLVAEGDIPLRLVVHARRAVAHCPRLALHLVERSA